MRFPSLKLLHVEARATLARFPFVLVSALVAFAAAFKVVDHKANHETVVNLLLAGQLGIPLLFALAVHADKRTWKRRASIALQLVGAALLVGYYFSLPDWQPPTVMIRFLQLNVAVHLLVAFLPYARAQESNGFWQYNKTLFLRFLTAVLYSAVLYGGLAIALLAIDQLLGVNVEGETYARLFFAVGLLFNTWFFLGGIPRDWPGLDRTTGYPRGLKVFTQYILVPIVIIYLVILTIYLVKIIVTREWPSGMIGYLVSAVSVAGIFSLLLVHPVRDRDENRWIQTFSKWFYVWLFPAILMLFLAIGKRIAQYGVTEMRYFLTVLTIWLTGTAIYFTLSRRKDIKVIPASLCLVAFATSFGPWGAYAVSQRSQTARLAGLLAANEMLVDDRIVPAAEAVPFDDRKEISAALSYLLEHHGTISIEPWFDGALADIDTTGTGTGPSRAGQIQERAALILDYMNVEYVARWERDTSHFSYAVNTTGQAIDISGYDVLYRISHDWGRTDSDSVTIADETLLLRYRPSALEIVRGDDAGLEIPISAVVDRLRGTSSTLSSNRQVPPDAMRVFAENDAVAVMLQFTHISGNRSDDGIAIDFAGADILIKLKPHD